MTYLYWFVRKLCAGCGQPFSCSVEQDHRNRCAACESQVRAGKPPELVR